MNKKNTPLHARILKEVQEKIVSGEWPPGHRIPFETEMAEYYNCSRMTVNKALTKLTAAGLLERTRKGGTFVKSQQTISAALEITNIKKEIEDAGKQYSYQLLSDKPDVASDIHQTLLDLSADAQIRSITCLHHANGVPFCYEERIINVEAVPEIVNVDFHDLPPGTWLVKKVPWISAEHQICAKSPTREVAQKLDIEPGSACLVIERKTKNDSAFITWVQLFYPGDQHRLVANFSPSG